jgi:hypothetical protein
LRLFEKIRWHLDGDLANCFHDDSIYHIKNQH